MFLGHYGIAFAAKRYAVVPEGITSPGMRDAQSLGRTLSHLAEGGRETVDFFSRGIKVE